jgi:hypothetical protein
MQEDHCQQRQERQATSEVYFPGATQLLQHMSQQRAASTVCVGAASFSAVPSQSISSQMLEHSAL